MSLARTVSMLVGTGKEEKAELRHVTPHKQKGLGSQVSSQFVTVTGANKLLQPSDRHGYRHCELSFLGRKPIRLHLRTQRQGRTAPSADTSKSQGRARFMRLEHSACCCRNVEDVPKA